MYVEYERRRHLMVALYRIVRGRNALYARSIVLLRTKDCFLTGSLCLASIVSWKDFWRCAEYVLGRFPIRGNS